MMKSIRIYFVVIFMIGLLYFSLTGINAVAEEAPAQQDVDISISPGGDPLFQVENMKPGDWAPRTVTVQNVGIQDFDYSVRVQNTGDPKLFNALVLEIKAGELTLYEGKMTDFDEMPSRKLVSGSEESLEMVIRFPEHLGNDYQGLEAAFSFQFVAEGQGNLVVHTMTEGLIGSSGIAQTLPTFPSFLTNALYLLIIGLCLLTATLIIMRHYNRMKPI